MRTTCFVLIPAALFGLGLMRCSSDSSPGNGANTGQPVLTPEWTPDMRVSCSANGGMVNESRRLDISTDSAVYEVHEERYTQRFRLDLTPAERNAIARVLYDNDFSNLHPREREGTLYDAPSASVLVCKGSNCCNRGDDAYTVYTGADAQRMETISAFLWKLGNERLEKLKVPFEVLIDEALLREPDEVHFQLSPGRISFTTTPGTRQARHTFSVLPGHVQVSAVTVHKDSTGYTRYPLSVDGSFSTHQGHTVRISKKNGNLQLEFIQP